MVEGDRLRQLKLVPCAADGAGRAADEPVADVPSDGVPEPEWDLVPLWARPWTVSVSAPGRIQSVEAYFADQGESARGSWSSLAVRRDAASRWRLEPAFPASDLAGEVVALASGRLLVHTGSDLVAFAGHHGVSSTAPGYPEALVAWIGQHPTVDAYVAEKTWFVAPGGSVRMSHAPVARHQIRLRALERCRQLAERYARTESDIPAEIGPEPQAGEPLEPEREAEIRAMARRWAARALVHHVEIEGSARDQHASLLKLHRRMVCRWIEDQEDPEVRALQQAARVLDDTGDIARTTEILVGRADWDIEDLPLGEVLRPEVFRAHAAVRRVWEACVCSERAG
jgi:hypothetical protein